MSVSKVLYILSEIETVAQWLYRQNSQTSTRYFYWRDTWILDVEAFEIGVTYIQTVRTPQQ